MKNEEIRQQIEQIGSTYPDWIDIENMLEVLEDAQCLNVRGVKFRNYIWEKYIKS